MKEYLKKHEKSILIFALLAAMTVALEYSSIGCVWRYFLHVECPGCGMTRAWFLALHGKIGLAFLEYPMFWCLPLILWLIWENGRIFKKNGWNTVTMISLAAMLLINYIFRLTTG